MWTSGSCASSQSLLRHKKLSLLVRITELNAEQVKEKDDVDVKKKQWRVSTGKGIVSRQAMIYRSHKRQCGSFGGGSED